MRNGIRIRRSQVLRMAVTAATATAAFELASPAHAATVVWSGGGATANWSNPQNWFGGTPQPGDSLVFDVAGPPVTLTQNDILAGTVFKAINFPATAAQFIHTGNGIKLGLQTTGTGITYVSDIANASGNGQTVNLPLTLEPGRHNISTAGAGLALGGAITQSKGSTAVFASTGGAINLGGSGLANDASGILGGWATIGTNWAALDGSNNVVPYAAYTDVAGGGVIADGPTTNVRIPVNGAAITTTPGTTNINSLLFGGPSAAAQTVTVGAGNTLVLGRNGGVFNTTGTGGTLRALTIGGGTLTAGNSTFGGNITLSSSLLPSVATFMTVSSAITDNGTAPVSVTVMGGYVGLTGANTHSGGTYILSGRVSQPGASTFGSGPVYVFPGGQTNPGVSQSNNFFIAGHGTSEANGLGALRMFGSADLSGTITLLEDASICATNNTVDSVSGKITGPGGLGIGHGNGSQNGGTIQIGKTSGLANKNDYAGHTIVTGHRGGTGATVVTVLKINTNATPSDNNNIMPHGATGSFNGGPTGDLILDADVPPSGAVRSATFDLNGTTQTINGLTNSSTAPANNFITSSTAGGHLILGDNNATATFSGIIRDGAGTLAVTKIGNGTQTFAGANTYTGATTVSAGTLVIANSLTTSSSVTAANDAVIEVAADGGNMRVIKTPSVSIASAAKIDLKDNKLITGNAVGTATEGVYNGLQGEVQRAYNFGSWNGAGLTTSMQLALDGIATVGVATGEQIRGLGPTDTDVWAGETINGASTIAMYTYAGDANLDGQVDAGDYGILDAFIQVPGATGYGNGDFNYDGFIDAADYGTIDNSIQFQGAPFPTSASTAALSNVSAVPEPAACGFAGLVAGMLFRRRRHNATR